MQGFLSTLPVLCIRSKKRPAVRRVSVKQLNPTYCYDHRSDFLRCVSVIERLPLHKGAFWCGAKPQIAQHTDRCIEVRPLSVRQIGIGLILA